MIKKILLAVLLLSFSAGLAQEQYWVFFTDKGDQNLNAICPDELFSPQALEKRLAQGIPISTADLPVWKGYLQKLQEAGIHPEGTSKWMNAAVAVIPKNRMSLIARLPFVRGIKPVARFQPSRARTSTQTDNVEIPLPSASPDPLDYGQARVQNNMLNIRALHDQGFTGKGVRIAVFDAGFRRADKLGVFDSLFRRGQVLAAYDFVEGRPEVYGNDNHGTQVLSTIAANVPGIMIGTAPDATFLLARTEDAGSETRQEEYNWVKAVEWADSIGVDIIHSSLGYSEFDTEEESYLFTDMNGQTTIVTKAADMAAARGILVVTSAGNEGSGSWRKITAPCDADSALCVGAIDPMQRLSSFSSIGPTADGRLKPDVVALGSRTTVANPNGNLSFSYGTSFSAPLIAGLATCLRQAHPERSSMDIIRAIKLSANRLANPDTLFGYGVPDAGKADSLLRSGSNLELIEKELTVRFSNRLAGEMIYENENLILRRKGQTLTLILSDNDDAIKKLKIKGAGGKLKLKAGGAGSSPSKWIFSTKGLTPGEYQMKVRSRIVKENLVIELPR